MATTHHMRMAKASKQDISEVTKLFTLWEFLQENDFNIESLDDDDEDKIFLRKFVNDGCFDKETFFQEFYSRIDCRWRRVIMGCDILIDNCCNPAVDYLELKPELAREDEKFEEGKVNLVLERPAIVFDIESTGLNTVMDRIIELGIIRIDPTNIFPDQQYQKFCFRFNPGMHIPEEATKIHGITDEDVANEPKFSERAAEIKAIFAGCDVIGYNSNWFDVPMLVEKFLEMDVEIFAEDTKFIDVQTIFKKKEERTLSAAVKFFLGKEHEGAHSAMADAEATFEILNAQIEHYPDIGNSVQQLAKYSLYQDKPIVDYAGKLVYNADGVICYNIGNAKGTPVVEDPSFGEWMLARDFSLDTKRKLRRILDEEYNNESKLF